MRELTSVVVSLFVWVLPLQAQGEKTVSCGSLSHAEARLAESARLFTLDGGSAFRSRHGIPVVSVGEVGLVTDESICGKLVPEVEADAQADYEPSDYAVYRFGDYYGVEISVPAPFGIQARSSLYVFKTKGAKLVTIVMQ